MEQQTETTERKKSNAQESTSSLYDTYTVEPVDQPTETTERKKSTAENIHDDSSDVRMETSKDKPEIDAIKPAEPPQEEEPMLDLTRSQERLMQAAMEQAGESREAQIAAIKRDRETRKASKIRTKSRKKVDEGKDVMQ